MPFYRKRIFWFLSAIILLAMFFILKRTFSAVDVKTTPVSRQELAITVTATSTGTIKSETEVKITAQRIGKITKLFVEEGSIVKPGSMIAELDHEEAHLSLNIALASLEKAKSILKEAETRLKRFSDLKEKGYISHIDFDSVQKEYNVAYAGVKEAENSLSLARLNYDYSFIKSPISGVVISRPVKVGETTAKGALALSLVAHVVSMADLYIEAFIDEADVAKVKLGQQANITMDAYQGNIFKGEIYLISPVVLGGKQETRTFEVRTRLKEKQIIIKPGMSADVEIIVDNIKNALVVPSHALMEKNGKKFVFIKKSSTAKLIPVETGQFNWNFTEITSGFKEGGAVIINPDAMGLADGKRVREKKKAE
ncbi:MAG: efflux RND transporter periplasmic adaptor subunit [Nitrospirota bacterium]|nr:efflux RND transporter periplasmic adaptor subunit [Nitrospirota bacterium]